MSTVKVLRCQSLIPMQGETLSAPGHTKLGNQVLLLAESGDPGRHSSGWVRDIRNPNAQSSTPIRRSLPTNARSLKTVCGVCRREGLQDNIKGKTIVVYTPNQSVEDFAAPQRLESVYRRTKVREFFHALYSNFPCCSSSWRLQRRLFTAQRYCFIGSVDWIDIGHGPLTTLVKTYVQHLGKSRILSCFNVIEPIPP
jgi:hypothetical protein